MGLSAAGIVTCALAMYGVIKLDIFGASSLAEQGDSPRTERVGSGSNGTGAVTALDGPPGFPSSPSVIRIQGQDGIEQVPTGTSAVPHFPSTITLPKSLDETIQFMQPGQEVRVPAEAAEEYQLLGLGVRTVSFLSIQVYVVGLYIAKSDISILHQRLIQTAMNPPVPAQKQQQQQGQEGPVPSAIVGIPAGVSATAATSLVPAERKQLQELLLDPESGEAAWNLILKEDSIRTVFRIVPTRNTDFLHLRDGWVRGITARAQTAIAKAKESGGAAEFEDEEFGSSLNTFKALFGGSQRKSVPKAGTLMLLRNAHGAMDALYQPDAAKPMRWLGRVSDERISRLVWLNYLAGKTVSSESARRSVVDGVLAIVERPMGTVVQKVV